MFNSCPRKLFSVNTLPLPMVKALLCWACGYKARLPMAGTPSEVPYKCNQEEMCLGFSLRADLLPAGP